MSVLAIVLPVFLVIVLGVVLTRTRFIGAELIGELNRLTYFVGLPAYLFSSISEAKVGGGRAMTKPFHRDDLVRNVRAALGLGA